MLLLLYTTFYVGKPLKHVNREQNAIRSFSYVDSLEINL